MREVKHWEKRDWLILAALIAYVLVTYLPGLGSYALWDPWETQYSQVAHEMVQHDSYIKPWYRNHNNWLSKPIMHLAMMGTSIRLFGESPFSLRLPVVLSAALCLVFVFVFLRRLWSRRAGIIGVVALATSPMFFLISRSTIPDTIYIAFQTTALIMLMIGLFGPRETEKSSVLWFYFFSALALLTKGLLSIMIPGAIIGFYILSTWDWNVLKRLRIPKGLLIFFLIGWPWFVYMMIEYGPIFYTKRFFWYHHFRRYAGDIKKPNATFDLYVKVFAYAMFPWTAFLPAALVRLVRKGRTFLDLRSKEYFLLLCMVIPYLFFSFASTKFNHYIYPSIPFAVMIAAIYLDSLLRRLDSKGARMELLFSLLIFALLAKDVVSDRKVMLHLFIYYYDRPISGAVRPWYYYALSFWSMGAVLISVWLYPLIKPFRKLSWGLVGLLAVAAIGCLIAGMNMRGHTALHLKVGSSALFTAAVVMSMQKTFKYRAALASAAIIAALFATVFMLSVNFKLVKPLTNDFTSYHLYESYMEHAKPGEKICEYHTWRRRSVSYFFRNAYTYIPSNKPNTKKIKNFFSRKGRLWCMVDHGSFEILRRKVKKESGKDLYIIDRKHPATYLVSTQQSGGASAGKQIPAKKDFLIKKVPNIKSRPNVTFKNSVRLAGCTTDKKMYKAGDTLELTCYYECLDRVGDDYLIFVHAETEEANGRIVGDHVPANGSYTTDKWRPGDIIKDVWTRKIPASVIGRELYIYTGFFKDKYRVPVLSGPESVDDRVLVATVRLAR